MNCPVHNTLMLSRKTKYGERFCCPVKDCTVASWSGGTSTPADAPTRQKRIQAHKLFDLRWKQGKTSRKEAYKWLQETMELPKKSCHIGMFDETQCDRLIMLLREPEIQASL